MLYGMSASVLRAIPVLPAADVKASLAWWVGVCGFTESFRHGTPPMYAGIRLGDADIHLAAITDPAVARAVGDQTMLRILVADVDAMHRDYLERGGRVHPNGGLQRKPWGSYEFATIDPSGVCVTFFADL